MLLKVSSALAAKMRFRTVEYATSVPKNSWKATTMIATSNVRMSGPYKPGWLNNWPYHVNVNVPVPLNTDDVKLNATTVSNGPSTKSPNRNQTRIVHTVRSSVVRENGHFSTEPSPPSALHPPITYFGRSFSSALQFDQL